MNESSDERLKSADARLSRAARRLQEANEHLHVAELEHRLASEAVAAAYQVKTKGVE